MKVRQKRLGEAGNLATVRLNEKIGPIEIDPKKNHYF